MKPYPKYKDSGIQWIGQIPEGWKVGRLKDISIFINGYAFNSNTFSKEHGKRVIRIGDIGSTIDYVNCIRTTEQSDVLEIYRIYENDILIAMSGATTGKSCLAVNVEEAYINQRVGIIRSEHYGYISYILQMPYLSEYISLNDAGSAQPNISGKSIGNLPISIPPVSEQESIVRYLDDKTTKIDETVNLLEQQKADLQQYRKALISQTVTRGLNPNAKLKDSGVDWIGQIPEGWMVDKVKNHILYIKSGDAIKYEKNNPSGDIPLYGGGAQIGYVDKSNTEIGDILIGRVGANCGCVTEVQQQSWATDNALIVRPKILSRYLVYILDSANLNKLSTSNAQPLVTSSKIKDFGIPIAPLPEQQEIVDYLDSKTTKIDEAIKRIDEQITDLRAYRTALISDVVTGKIDVRI